MTEKAQLRIDSIAAGGAGVGRLDGLAVFVPRTAPGDLVEVDLRRHKRYAEGRPLRVQEEGPGRVEARCVHYTRDACGGCQLQHLDYPVQLEAKGAIVSAALRRIGRREAQVHAPVPSPSPWQYRNKLTLALRNGPRGWVAGLRPWYDPDQVFPLTECPITRPEVLATWREIMSAADHLPHAVELRGAVRVEGDGATVHIEGGESWDDADHFIQRCPSLRQLIWRDDRGRERHLLRSGDSESGAASFAQVNAELAPALHAHAAEAVSAVAPRHVIDAYAGSGAIAMRVRAPGRRVTLIELDRAAARDAARRLGHSATVITGRVEHELEGALPADVVILNPPRAGVDAAVCEILERRRAGMARLVYVSCDPATLARDLSRLPSWRVVDATPFDMFPQTAHVETVCVLQPEAA